MIKCSNPLAPVFNGLIYDLTVVDTASLTKRRADWEKVAQVWPKVAAFIADPKTRDEAVQIMAARVNVKPAQYAKALPGTRILDVAGMKKAFTPSEGLDSILGSSKTAHAFNLANKVYEKQLDPAAFLEPAFVMALK